MDGSFGNYQSLETLKPELVSGLRPGGNPRFKALASIAGSVAGQLGLSPADVLRYLLQGGFVEAAEKFVDQLTYVRPDEPTTRAKRRNANLAAIDALDRPMSRSTAAALFQFTGWGGLSLDEVREKINPKYRQSSLALLHEWYTPTRVSDAIATLIQPLLPGLANRYGIISALEPSAGVGRFIDSINRATSKFSILWTAVELNRLSAEILRRLHPSTRVHIGPYELFNRFRGDREFNLIVANPPFGSGVNTRTFAMIDPAEEFMDSRDFPYFLKRSIHALSRCGVAVFIVPRRFMSGKSWEVKLRRHIFRRVHLLTAYRLPSLATDGKGRLFPSMETVVDVVVVRNRGGLLLKDAPDDEDLIAGNFFRENPDNRLGVEYTNKRGRVVVQGDFHGFPRVALRDECTSCEAQKKRKVKVVKTLIDRSAELEWAAAIGIRVKEYLASLGTSKRPISWAEVITALTDVKSRVGNVWQWDELRELADSKDQGATALLRSFTHSGEIVAELANEPTVEIASDDPAVIASLLSRGDQTVSLASIRAAHRENGGTLTDKKIRWHLKKAGFVVFKGRYMSRQQFLAGDLWERYDQLDLDDPLRDLILDTLKPLVFEDIEFDPRSSWLPVEVLNTWLNEDEPLRLFGVYLQRDDLGDVVPISGDGDNLGQIVEWLNQRMFWAVGKPDLPVTEIPDELHGEMQRLAGLGQKNRLPNGILRRLWDIYWLRSFRIWLSANKVARELATRAYNRTFRRFAPLQVDDKPLVIHRWTKNPKLQLRPHQVKAVKERVATKGGILALAVGAGKTFTSLAVIAIGRQEGWIRRPVIVVPTAIVWQWYEEVGRVLPDYRVGVVGSIRQTAKSGPRKGQEIIKTATAVQRSRVWLKFQAGLYDLVLLTDSSLDRTSISTADMDAYNSEVTSIRSSIRAHQRALANKPEKKLSERERAFISNSSAAWSERMLKNDGREYDPGVDWTDLGIDFFVWDETGNIRNTWSPASGFFGVPKYMGSSRGEGAQRAWQADYRASSVRRRGGGVLGLSGTVGENSPAEVYNLLHFIDPKIMENVGILNIDEFVNRYIVVEDKRVVSPTGEHAIQSAVVGYKNLNELRNILFRHGSFVSHEQAGIQLPESNELLVEVTMSPIQKKRYRFWRKLARDAIDPDVETEHGDLYAALNKMREVTIHPMLGMGYDWSTAFGGLARKNVSTTSLHRWEGAGWKQRSTIVENKLSDPNLPSEQRAKLEAEEKALVAKRRKGITLVEKTLPRPKHFGSPKFDECARRILANPQCGHVVFVESTAAHRWFIEVLAEGGMSRERIAVINGPAKPDVEKIASDFNGSESRARSLDVVISNAKGARGVNLQREACMLHNIDLRWTPADMEQRRGRIDRFGNTMPVINIIFYFAKESFDAFIFDILAGKGSWRDSLFLREGDRSINPAAQLELDDTELLLLTAESKEEGLRLKAEIEKRKREREFERAGIAAVKMFERAVGRIREAAKAETSEERESLRAQARDLLDTVEAIDERAWPFKGAIRELWEGDPLREWLITTAKKPPITSGIMLDFHERATDELFDRKIVARQVGAFFGDKVGLRDNGSAEWHLGSIDENVRYSSARPSDNGVDAASAAEHWQTWRFAHTSWVTGKWWQFRERIYTELKTNPKLKKKQIPFFTSEGAGVLEDPSVLSEEDIDYILPPTLEGFRIFEAWSPVIAWEDVELERAALQWFGRKPHLDSRSLYRRRKAEKIRISRPEDAECDTRVLGLKPNKLVEWSEGHVNFVRAKKTGLHRFELFNDVELEFSVDGIESGDDLRIRVLTTMYRDFVDRWFRLRTAQQRHLKGEVDRVLPEYYRAIKRAYNTIARVIGHQNASVIQVCAQFSSQDHAEEYYVHLSKLPRHIRDFVGETRRLREHSVISFVPLTAEQTLTVKSIPLPARDKEQVETLLSAKGNLFRFELPQQLDLTLPASEDRVYLISIVENGETVNSWLHVHPEVRTELANALSLND